MQPINQKHWVLRCVKKVVLVLKFVSSIQALQNVSNSLLKNSIRMVLILKSLALILINLLVKLKALLMKHITALISDAFSQITKGGGVLSQEVLERAIDKEIRKIIFHDNKEIPEEEQRFLAAFWAGVCVAAHELPAAHKISCVTTHPVMVNFKEELIGSDLYFGPEELRKEKQTGIVRGKIWTYHTEDTTGFETEAQRIAHIKIYLAGRAAERIIMGTTSSQQANMRQWAFDQIKALITQGIDFTKLSHKAQDEIVDQAQARLLQYEKEVEELLMQQKDVLAILTEVLATVIKSSMVKN